MFDLTWAKRIVGPSASLFLVVKPDDSFDVYTDPSRSGHLLHAKAELGRGFEASHVSTFATDHGWYPCCQWHVYDAITKSWVGAFVVLDELEVTPRRVRFARWSGHYEGELVDRQSAGSLLRDVTGASVPIQVLLGGEQVALGARSGDSQLASQQTRLDLHVGSDRCGDLRVPLVAMAFL